MMDALEIAQEGFSELLKSHEELRAALATVTAKRDAVCAEAKNAEKQLSLVRRMVSAAHDETTVQAVESVTAERDALKGHRDAVRDSYLRLYDALSKTSPPVPLELNRLAGETYIEVMRIVAPD